MKRSTPFLALAAGVALALSAFPAPASAASFPVSTIEELTAALAGCTGANTVTLEADITAVEALRISCDVHLELEGHALFAPGVSIDEPAKLTIDDAVGSGQLVSAGGGPGIWVPSPAALVVNGGEITATGGSNSPGIGGVPFGGTGSITINGGEVHATGTGYSAGIGGGFFGSAGALAVSGGSVEAIGAGVAGIGAGGNGSAGTTQITGGTVVMSGYPDVLNARSVGSLTISGSGVLSLVDGFIGTSSQFGVGITIGAGGQLVGVLGDETVGGSVVGDLPMQNGGVIGLDESRVLAAVVGNDFEVGFDPQNGDPVTSVRLFAPDFATGYRSMPTPPAGTAWTTAPDGSGVLFTHTTPVVADMTLYAVDAAYPELAYSLEHCTDGDIVVVTEDLSGGPLVIGCAVTLDLAGHTLSPEFIDVLGGAHLTVDDTVGAGQLNALHPTDPFDAGIHVPSTAALTIRAGTVTAVGGMGAAIGGAHTDDVGEAAGTIRIEGGHVTATASYGGAGIGGGMAYFGMSGAGGDVTITGGVVVAKSLFGGSGIGGGSGYSSGGGEFPGGPGGTVTITGGTVDAYGIASGIGGGIYTAGGTVVISGGSVTASANYGSAIGGGGPTAGFGSLTVSGGTLHVPTGSLLVPDSDSAASEVTIASGGLMMGADATPTAGATITGDGQIDNHGVIALDGALVDGTLTVNDHDYLVGFDAQDGSPVTSIRLFAPDFQSGYRTVPATAAPDAWNTAADDGGDWFDATSPVSADLTLYAVTDATLTLVASSDSVAQGGSVSFDVTGENHDGEPVDTSGVVLSSSVATDVVDGLTVTFPHSSPHVITATLGDATATVVVEVQPASASLAASGAGGTDALLLAAVLFLGLGATALKRTVRRSTVATAAPPRGSTTRR